MLTSRAQRIVFWTGLLFLASGVFHVGVWALAGMPSLDGPVTWRKPITFGVSTGVLSLSIAWVIGLIPHTSRLVRQAWLFSALLIAEVALIDMQQWRGVPSHFNNTTAFDGAVFTVMGMLIMAVSVLIAIWTIALMRRPAAVIAEDAGTSRQLVIAARAGMVLLNIGNLIGIVMAAFEMTALKSLHGVALHGLQAVPVAVWLVSRLAGRARYQPACYPRAWRDVSHSARSLSSPGWRRQ